jgi:DNA-binding beta-propeller fold protein YncE
MKQLYFFITIIFLNSFNLIAQTTTVSGVAEPFGLILNGNDLYISASDGGGILKVDISAPTPTAANLVVSLGNPRYMELNANDLYASTANGIYKIDISATSPTASLVVNGLSNPYGLALKGNDLYIAEAAGNKISKIDITSATPTPVDVVTGLNAPYGLTFNGDDLYIAEFNGNKISKIDVASTTPSLVDVVTGLNGPMGLALSGNDLYIAEFNFGSKVSKIDITTTSTATDVVTGLKGASGVVINGNDLYIAEFLNNRISKLNLSTLSITDNSFNQSLNISPNPSSNFIQILGLTKRENYLIYNTLGLKINNGSISENEKIDIQIFSNGIYFIKFENGFTLKFIKE